jgi:selenophosphate synthase
VIGLLEQSETEWKKLRSPSVSEKSEVADAHKAARQQVQEEAAQELIDGQSQQPLLVAVSGVAPAKSYVALGESN